jgi:hypothetical protein
MKKATEYWKARSSMAASNKLEDCVNALIIPFDANTSFRTGTRLATLSYSEVSEGIEYTAYTRIDRWKPWIFLLPGIFSPFGNVWKHNRIEQIGVYFLKRGKNYSPRWRKLDSWPLISLSPHYTDLVVLQLVALLIKEHYL